MKLAIVGSRTFADAALLTMKCAELRPTSIVSGGAKGADTLAESFAKQTGLPLILHRPDYAKYGRRAPIVRNDLIVNDADHLIAFWDGKSKGTKYTIELAKKRGVAVTVVMF